MSWSRLAVYPGCQVAGRPTASHMISRFLMRKLTVQGKSNVEFENLDVQVLNLHDGMSKDYKDLPMRLLAIDYVVRASYIASYEEVPSCHYLQMPYSETTQELWNQVAVVSWRWGMAKPDKMTTGFSPMSRVQLQELQRYLALSDNLQYVWIDWSCVPQYDIDPMFEVARSKLFYSRARVMVIIPEYLPLPEEHLMRVMISSAVRALARGVPGTAGETDEENQQMAYKGLKHVRESGIYASFGYFGRVWTLAGEAFTSLQTCSSPATANLFCGVFNAMDFQTLDKAFGFGRAHGSARTA